MSLPFTSLFVFSFFFFFQAEDGIRDPLVTGVQTCALPISLWVPVGEDQVSHVEISRKIVRSFNSYYGLEVDEDLFRRVENAKVLKRLRELSPQLKALEIPDPVETNQLVLAYKGLLERYIAEAGFRNFREKVAQDGRFFRSVAVLEEPGVMLTKTPRIPGLDG